jgi:NHL repeat-containing protein
MDGATHASYGRFLKSVGSRGSAAGQLDTPHSIAADAEGRIYVVDGGNARIQVFDNDLNPRAMYDTVGYPWALCITSDAHRYLYSAVNPGRKDENTVTSSHEIYKMELDGTIVGKFGRPGNAERSVKMLHSMECRHEHEIVAAQFGGAVVIIKLQPKGSVHR